MAAQDPHMSLFASPRPLSQRFAFRPTKSRRLAVICSWAYQAALWITLSFIGFNLWNSHAVLTLQKDGPQAPISRALSAAETQFFVHQK